MLDLGCGAGKLALYARRDGARAAGLDVAPFFLPARGGARWTWCWATCAGCRSARAPSPRAYSLDVLEHLDEAGVRDVLRGGAARAGAAAARLFVYTHAMESSRLAAFQRGVNRLARRLGRAGLIDHEREAMRKSDHRNAIRSHEHFDALCAEAGLRRRPSAATTTSSSRRWWRTSVLRLFEQGARAEAATDGHGHEHGHEHGRRATGTAGAAAPGRVAHGRRPRR